MIIKKISDLLLESKENTIKPDSLVNKIGKEKAMNILSNNEDDYAMSALDLVLMYEDQEGVDFEGESESILLGELEEYLKNLKK